MFKSIIFSLNFIEFYKLIALFFSHKSLQEKKNTREASVLENYMKRQTFSRQLENLLKIRIYLQQALVVLLLPSANQF